MIAPSTLERQLAREGASLVAQYHWVEASYGWALFRGRPLVVASVSYDQRPEQDCQTG